VLERLKNQGGSLPSVTLLDHMIDILLAEGQSMARGYVHIWVSAWSGLSTRRVRGFESHL